MGLWSYNLASRFLQVHAFEPIAAHRECFIENVKSPNVTLHPCALSFRNDMIDMATEHGSSGNSTVNGPGGIPMMLLDSFNFQDVDFIKIDVEGFEENVLRGATETIARFGPTVIVEQKRDMAARFDLELMGAVTFLKKQFGYHVIDEISGDYIMVPGHIR